MTREVYAVVLAGLGIHGEVADAVVLVIERGQTAEREACAQIAERDSSLDWLGGSTGSAKGTATNIAKAIRARSESCQPA